MLHVRSNIVYGAAGALSRALTIAIRFSVVRRQGNDGPDGKEVQVDIYIWCVCVCLCVCLCAFLFMCLEVH